MFKRVSLAKKITGGFLVILILLIGLAFVGRLGLSRVVEKVDSTNLYESLVSHILKARQNEKKFILHTDQTAAQQVEQAVTSLKKLGEQILENSGSLDMKKQIDQILNQVDQYAKAFSNYVSLAGKKDQLMADMNHKASAALDITAGIRDDQKQKYNALRDDSEVKIGTLRTRVMLATRIHDAYLEATGHRMALREIDIEEKPTVLEEWKGKHRNLTSEAERVRPLLEDDTAKERLADLLAAQKAVIERALMFFNDKTDENNAAVVKAALELKRKVITFQQEMQEQLEFYIEDVQIFSGQMMELSSGADQIAKILLNTRILEKEFIRSEDEAAFTTITGNIASIDGVIAEIKENIDDEEKTRPLEGITDAVKNYLTSFTSYADLMKEQKTVETAMEKSASDIQKICSAAKEIEQGRMYQQIGNSKLLITIGSVFAVFAGIIIAFVLTRMIIRPLNNVLHALEDISQGDGDLTQRIEVRTEDEIGQLARSFNAFVEKLNKIIVDIGTNSETVTAASGELLVASEQMAGQADDLFGRSNSVAAAAEEMSANMNSVAAASEQAATNVGAVADSAGQMKLTLNEVAANCDKARQVSEKAAHQVKYASERVGLLGEAAREISKVTEVITDIAEQTNLLALNATIEAARAGEAGRGFAVVASEIKGLANQTANATLDIRDKISGIQNSTEDTVEDVEQISAVISDVTEIVSAIAAAVDEQSASASEVAMNIEQASLGIGEVNENVSQSSQVSSEISGDITQVSVVAEEMNAKSSQMSSSARDLSDLSSRLRDMISIFRVSVDDVEAEPSGYDPSQIPDLMPWNAGFETGIPEIDQQHQVLVRLINQLHKAMKMKLGAREAGRILDELADYTVKHFSHEEALFDTHTYADAPSHKTIHQELVGRVIEFQNDFKAGRAALSMDLMTFLTDWLKHHILEIDMAYVPFLKEKLSVDKPATDA